MPPTDSFAALNLSDALLAAITALDYEEPTPVQRATIPLLLAGKDLLAQAATGTGKTAAFALPILHLLSATPGQRTRALILVPTRELAMQVSEAVHKYGRGSGLSVVPVYGGASIGQQIRALERRADIVVATPGRALDHVRRQSIDLSHLQILVLDEADEMLDMGFADDLDAILEEVPTERQTALFSATMPARILTIAQRHLTDPQRITIARDKTAAGKAPRVRQVAYVAPRAHKPAALQRVLDMEGPSSALVFCRTRLEVDSLTETLNAHGNRAEGLHGGMAQRQRDAVMNRLRTAKTDLLIATDVAARGLDVPQLSHVFNYDLPSSADVYVHRIGRVGRAGREGTAMTLMEPREHRHLRLIENVTKQKIEVAQLPTVADLRARGLELVKASLRERLLQGDLDDVRVVIESLAEEFDLVDIAAAAVKLAHAATGSEAVLDIPEPPPAPRPSREPKERVVTRQGQPRLVKRDGGVTRLFVGAGRVAGIRPGDLVGMITGEAGIASRELGAIEIADRFSLVEVPRDRADEIIVAMRKSTLRGQKVLVRRDRETT